MGQEFHVLRCFSCLAFQSHQVRKDKKFVCKLCGAKQSVKKDYGRGTGKDCRVHVQKLNSLRGNLEKEQEERLESQNDGHGEPGSSWKSSLQSSGTFTLTECHDTNIGNSADNADRASSSVYDQKSKWASYMTTEADNSEEDTVTDSTPGISFRHNHIIKEGLDTGLRHKSPRIIQNKCEPQNSYQGPVRSHVKKTELLKWNKEKFGPYPGSSINMRGSRSAAIEVLINKPALIGGGEPEGLVAVDDQSFKSDEMQMDNSITSRGIVKIPTTCTAVLERKQQCGDNEENAASFTGLQIRNLATSKVGHATIISNNCANSGQRSETWSHQGDFKSGILKGCTVKEIPCDNLKGKATAMDNKQAVHATSLGEEHKLNHFIFKQNNTQNHILTNAKQIPISSSMNLKRPLSMKNQLTGGLIVEKNSSDVSQGVYGPSSALSQKHSDFSNKCHKSICPVRTCSFVQLYSKYEAADELEDITNFDL